MNTDCTRRGKEGSLKQAISWPRAVPVLCGIALGAASAGPVAAAQPQPWEVNLQPAGSPIMEMIHAFSNGTLILMSLIVLLVLSLLVVVMIRFNARRNPVPSKTSHNTLIEVIWTVVPILILVGIAVPSFALLLAQHDPARAVPNYDPDKTLTIKATGSQWFWSYAYPDHEGVEFDSLMLTDAEITDPATQPRLLAVDNQLVVPTGTVIDMQVIGADVIHSFAVPSLGFKIDAIPGRLNETWFMVREEGVYYGQCSELCGRDHAFMPIAIRAVSPEKFDAWVEAAAGDLDAAYAMLDSGASPPAAGEGAETAPAESN
ncbi:MAG: cytochrome c oxidase subunit II [Bauldia sp.]|nr:cytochrome c oxidase subunit II [Bauldia sp.]